MMMNGEEINAKISIKKSTKVWAKYFIYVMHIVFDTSVHGVDDRCQRIIAHETNFQTEVRAKIWECVCCGERFRDCDHELQYCSRADQE